MSHIASSQGGTGGGHGRRAAAWVLLGLVFFVALFWQMQEAAQMSSVGPRATDLVVPPQVALDPEPSRRDPAPLRATASAPAVIDDAGVKPVVIGVVTPWDEIAGKPQYAQASPAGRRAILDLYWHTCVESKVPAAQRAAAYELFVRRAWTMREGAGSGSSSRTRTGWPPARSPQETVPSPVNVETMRRWCGQ